jgi:hypothetical protein
VQGSNGSYKVIGRDLYVKECRHSRIFLGGNVEFLEKAWKNQGLRLALSANIYFQNIIPKFEDFLARSLSPPITYE